MDKLKSALSGKKTYLAVGFGAIYMLGVWLGFWEFNQAILDAVGLGGLAFLRMGITKAAAAAQTKDTP